MHALGTAVIGAGRWGRNLVRVVAETEALRLAAVCDLRQAQWPDLPDVRCTSDIKAILRDPRIEAVVIATPPDTHEPIAEAALQANKHVLCEKPLAMHGAACRRLAETADERNLCLMVDCTPVYLTEIEQARVEIPWGEVIAIQCRRFSIRPLNQAVDPLWDLAPHDLAVIDSWIRPLPGEWDLEPLPDGLGLRSRTARGTEIEVAVGYAPVAAREIVVTSDRRTWTFRQEQKEPEPLKTVLSQFVDAIRCGRMPVTNGHQAARIADILTGVLHAVAV